ncbi:MAG: acyl-ACP--UDP-N-acetylglucosamine O-acyltransferase [Blastochloris sp.]|nr:acyl-ACP--UDP-N-acetylglucosamine O-acyltransferase [Blastochloris sp.]
MSTQIHPRALIHPQAKVGGNCIIGPDVVIDEHVEVGEGCEIRARAVITGHTVLGSGNQIGYGAIIGAEPQDLAYQNCLSHTRIGHRNVIREYVTIHRGTKEGSSTVIGDENYLMTGVHVAHNCLIGNQVILVNNVLLGGYVEVKDHAFLGGDSVVHQFTRVGEHVMVRGQTRLGLDVPPYFMAVATNAVCGLNRVGLKRKGFDSGRRKKIMEAYHLLYHAGKNRLQALESIRSNPELQHPDIELLCRFLEETKRGICRAVTSAEVEE